MSSEAGSREEHAEYRDGEAGVSCFECAPTVMPSPISKCEGEWPESH